jgi:hypothetical protein
MGICEDYMADPLHRFREPERQVIKQRISELVDAGVLDLSQYPQHAMG